VKTRLLVTGAILASLAAPGCTTVSNAQPHTAQTQTIDVSTDDVMNQGAITRDVTLAVGDTLKLSLGLIYGTPFDWTADTNIGDPSVVQQTSHEDARPTSGWAGVEVWTFTALKAGATTIATEYTQLSTSRPTASFTANVTVQ
jgi:inhibitor of cysteine peptidase